MCHDRFASDCNRFFHYFGVTCFFRGHPWRVRPTALAVRLYGRLPWPLEADLAETDRLLSLPERHIEVEARRKLTDEELQDRMHTLDALLFR